MTHKIIIKEVPIEEAVKVNAAIVEFDEPYQEDYFNFEFSLINSAKPSKMLCIFVVPKIFNF